MCKDTFFVWYFSQMHCAFLLLCAYCCGGHCTIVCLPMQQHDFIIAPRCVSGHTFSSLQYHSADTVVLSLIHYSTKALVLQYHRIWFACGTANWIQLYLDEKIILLYNCLSVIIYLPPDFHRLAIIFFCMVRKIFLPRHAVIFSTPCAC